MAGPRRQRPPVWRRKQTGNPGSFISPGGRSGMEGRRGGLQFTLQYSSPPCYSSVLRC